MRKLILAIVCWPLLAVPLLTLSNVVHAEQVRGLYTTTVPINGQSQSERAEVLPLAFQQVLVKVTGQSIAQQDEVLQGLAQNAARYVAQFRYVQSRAVLGKPASLKLWVQFDKNAVDGALQGVAPVWSSERPLVLALVAYDYDGKRRLLSSGDQDELSVQLRRMVKGAAASRGIPYVLPVNDRQDQRQLRATDIWSGFYRKVSGLQAKYAADAALIMRVKVAATSDDGQESGQEGGLAGGQSLPLVYSGAGRWLVMQDGATGRSQAIPSADLPSVVQVGVDGLAENLAAEYAQIESADAFVIAENLQLTVAGVNGYQQYRQVLEHLAGRTGVTSVRLASVGGDEIRVNLELSGDVEQFQQALRLGRYLQPEAPLIPNPMAAVEPAVSGLRYRVIQ